MGEPTYYVIFDILSGFRPKSYLNRCIRNRLPGMRMGVHAYSPDALPDRRVYDKQVVLLL